MANNTINGKQCTIIWNVEDLKISHVKDVALDRVIAEIEKVFVQEARLLYNRDPCATILA